MTGVILAYQTKRQETVLNIDSRCLVYDVMRVSHMYDTGWLDPCLNSLQVFLISKDIYEGLYWVHLNDM